MTKLVSNYFIHEAVTTPPDSDQLQNSDDQATGADVLDSNPHAQIDTKCPSPTVVIARSKEAVRNSTECVLIQDGNGKVKKIVCDGLVFTPQANDNRIVIEPVEQEFSLEPPPHDKFEDGIPSSQVIDPSELKEDNPKTVKMAGNKRWR